MSNLTASWYINNKRHPLHPQQSLWPKQHRHIHLDSLDTWWFFYKISLQSALNTIFLVHPYTPRQLGINYRLDEMFYQKYNTSHSEQCQMPYQQMPNKQQQFRQSKPRALTTVQKPKQLNIQLKSLVTWQIWSEANSQNHYQNEFHFRDELVLTPTRGRNWYQITYQTS